MPASRTKTLDTSDRVSRTTRVEETAQAPKPATEAGATEERRRLSEGYITRADLYAEAKRRGIEGRSKLTKAELRDLLSGRS